LWVSFTRRAELCAWICRPFWTPYKKVTLKWFLTVLLFFFSYTKPIRLKKYFLSTYYGVTMEVSCNFLGKALRVHIYINLFLYLFWYPKTIL
jgi:hypothetical protein